MPAVSDASPLNVLIRAGHVELLPRLFGEILTPPAVVAELSRPAMPEVVRLFISTPPPWLRVLPPSVVDHTLRLGLGEREAISLARERQMLLLVDDRDARRAASKMGVRLVGTVGILEQAARLNLISLPDVLAKIQATDFRASRRLIDEALARDAQRKQAADQS